MSRGVSSVTRPAGRLATTAASRARRSGCVQVVGQFLSDYLCAQRPHEAGTRKELGDIGWWRAKKEMTKTAVTSSLMRAAAISGSIILSLVAAYVALFLWEDSSSPSGKIVYRVAPDRVFGCKDVADLERI